MSLILGGNWCIVLQGSKKICYPVGWLACTISITLVSKRPIIYNLVEIVVLEPFADSISLPFESTCLLDKKIKRKIKKTLFVFFLKFKWAENVNLIPTPTPFPPHTHPVMGVSQGSKKDNMSNFYCFRSLDISYPSQAANWYSHKKSPWDCQLALAYVWWQYSVLQYKHVPEIGL